ncbi:hypothetical protein D3C83_218550 [compost metagenome]
MMAIGSSAGLAAGAPVPRRLIRRPETSLVDAAEIARDAAGTAAPVVCAAGVNRAVSCAA